MSNGGQFGTALEAKRLCENLLSDLRTLSTEARKKYSQVKEAAEFGLVKIKNISAASNEHTLLTNIREASAEILQPLILGCSSKNARLVQVSLQAIQKMVQHRVIESASAHIIVSELWHLMEAECEELRILQTLAPLVGTELLVTGQWLSKCLVMCFRLNFAKDPIVINTASATVRQLVSCVYERVVQEDSWKNSEVTVSHQALRVNAKAPPPTLRPCASDSYMLFYDLCLLINAEAPCWLIGIHEMTRTLGLELLESILSSYPSVFTKHPEFAQLLKDEVCPLIIKLFAPNHKQMQITSQHPYSSNSRLSSECVSSQIPSSPERVYFPILMRLLRVIVVLITLYYNLLVTECEIFLSLLVKFLESDKLGWQRAIALEVLHKIVVLPELLIWFCKNYDVKPSATKIISLIVSSLAGYVHSLFLYPNVSEILNKDEDQLCETIVHSSTQSGFHYNGVWVPLCENITSRKSLLLDSLEKHEASNISDEYALSLTYNCVISCCNSVFEAAESLRSREERPVWILSSVLTDVARELYDSTYANLLTAVSIFLGASVDENVTDQLLKCFTSMTLLSCRLGNTSGRDATFFALCRAALPPKYLVRLLSGIHGLCSISTSLVSLTSHSYIEDKFAELKMEKFENDLASTQPSQIVAVGTICPTPSLPLSMYSATIMLTAKNIQVARVLVSCATTNGHELGNCWHLVLGSIQHLVWILGMAPSLSECEVCDGTSLTIASHSNTNVLTTAAMADIPILTVMLNELFDSTAKLDEVALHHVIAALCKLSSEAMTVSRMANLSRLEVFWKPVTAHLIEVSGHPYAKIREWGAHALTVLVKSAFKTKTGVIESVVHLLFHVFRNSIDTFVVLSAKRQELILSPLSSMSEIEYVDVRRKQIECLLIVLQSAGQQFTADQWPTVIDTVRVVVEGKLWFAFNVFIIYSCDEVLVKQSYEAISLIITDFLDTLPLNCIQLLVETDAKYGSQQCELNISLSALGQLWTISDFVYRNSLKLHQKDCETIWLVLYNCLSELCVDIRPPVRKSACQTLLQTIAAHGLALKLVTWKHMIWKVIFPMLDKVRALTRSASTTRTDSSALGASNILIHHSRDTESKQWAETSVQTLSGVVKIFNAQRALLLALDDFPAIWTTFLHYIEYLAASGNCEMTLAALKSFQELLVGKGTYQNYEVNVNEKFPNITSGGHIDDELPDLSEELWLVCWRSWLSMARTLVLVKRLDLDDEYDSSLASARSCSERKFIPGPAHLITLLHIFVPLFKRVHKGVSCDDFKHDGIPSILEGIVNVPLTTDPVRFVAANANDITPTLEAVLNCIRIIYQDMLESSSVLRSALPDLIRLVLSFTTFAVSSVIDEYTPNKAENKVIMNMVPFAELSLRIVVEFYANTAHFQEIVYSAVIVDIVKCLAQPMELKYQCPFQSTWKAAASAFVTVLRVGLPIARQQYQRFHALWPVIATTIDRFLFNNSRPSCPLNADERKKHEFIDCQFIELIRTEILPYTNMLPSDFMQKIIDTLNRGSISTADSSDVLALDTYAQRTELSKVCFEALLSMSQNEERLNVIRGVATVKFFGCFIHIRLLDFDQKHSVDMDGNKANQQCISSSNLGTSAISSLLARCKEVMLLFVRDELNAGHLRLSQERIVEMISVLHAISTLIEGLVRRIDNVNVDFYQELVNLYPTIIDCITSTRSDTQVEQALIAALKSYHRLLLLNLHISAKE
ncbi:unnamed protein product [Thelazia callipaeda]|uniref:Protein MON2 homolog n=1 Tax=Thelazia callipaeda TaxID=103827 RepID=A0A158RCT6_THECL|nr:unnamed protein product [Thelazia callipaeda]